MLGAWSSSTSYYLHRDPVPARQPHMLVLAQEHIDMCMAIKSHNAHHHHHGGAWFVMPRNVPGAILILTVIQNSMEFCPPRNRMAIMRYTIKYLLATLSTVVLNVTEIGITLKMLFIATYRKQ